MTPTAEMCKPLFEIQQRYDPDGALRVILVGEIDIAVVDRLTTRLEQLNRSARRVRLDLSQPRFIDCRGIGAIIDAVTEARRAGYELEVARRVSPSVARIIALTGVAANLWPAEAAADPLRVGLMRPSPRQPRRQGVSAHV
jgi:anti-anti-sigma factor